MNDLYGTMSPTLSLTEGDKGGAPGGLGPRVSDRTMVGPLAGTTARLVQLQLAKDVIARI
jgi:hypothetical protein